MGRERTLDYFLSDAWGGANSRPGAETLTLCGPEHLGWGLYQAAVGRAVAVVARGRRWSLLFLGHVSPSSCPGALPWHYPVSVGGSEKLGPTPQSFWSRSQTFGALCCWPPRTQNMADGAQANPKGFRKKVLVKHPSGWRGPNLRASSSRTSRYVPAPLGWSLPWRGAGLEVGSWLLESISPGRRDLRL